MAVRAQRTGIGSKTRCTSAQIHISLHTLTITSFSQTTIMSSQQYWDQVDENILLEYLKKEEEEKKATEGEL